MKLNELGHPDYLTESSLPPVLCSEHKENVHLEVLRMQEFVADWKLKVSKLQSRYTWLLYFSIPKMLLFYKQINSSSKDIDTIVHEVSFIVYNQKIERTQLRQGVLVSF